MRANRDTLTLGQIVGAKRQLGMTAEQRSTHMHVVGASGTGKSKFLESLIRQDILARRGLCLIDPHGELAQNVLSWVATLPAPPRRFLYVAPHRDDWTLCYNPLRQRPGQTDEWFVVNALKIAVVKVWGADDTLQTPMLDEWLKNAFYTAITLSLTLPEVALLFEPIPERNVQRQAVAATLPESASRIKAAWIELCNLVAKHKSVDFEGRVGSTQRRLSAFLDNPRLARIFGVPDVSLDLADCMDEGAVVLVDLSSEGRFHPKDGALFGTLLLTDFYIQMFSRKRRERPFTLYIDEFQNYATRDLARLLDEARKFGLRLVLAHQRPGQLQNSDAAEDRDLYSAVMTNTRTKVVFGGVSPQELEPIAQLLSMGKLDPKKVKETISTRSVVEYVKEYWQAHGVSLGHAHTSGSGGGSSHASASGGGAVGSMGATFDPSGGILGGPARLFTSEGTSWQSHFGTSEGTSEHWMEADSDSEVVSQTTFPVLVPQLGEQLSAIYYETLEEQLYQFMAILYDQEQRHAMVRVVGQKEPLPIVVPTLKPARARPEAVKRQLELSYRSPSAFLPVAEADRRVADRRQRFLETVPPDDDEGEDYWPEATEYGVVQ